MNKSRRRGLTFLASSGILTKLSGVRVKHQNPEPPPFKAFCQQTEAAAVMASEGVQIESWAPFAEGRNNLFGNGTLVSLAAKYRKSVAQVVLRWLIQRGVVVIPKSVRPERMAENIAVFDFHLAPEDMDLIATLDTRRSCFLSHRDPETVKWLGTMKYEMD